MPGHSLVDELLRQWDRGAIHVDPTSKSGIVIDEEAIGWYRGVIGERRVAAVLDQLGTEWTVLHSVPVGRGTSDIDHIVIGHAGVFTINTKYSPGRKVWTAGYGMYVDGHPQAYVRNSVNEAARASALLSKAVGMTIPVTGLIVFVDPGPMTRKESDGSDLGTDVRVIRDSDLLASLEGRRVFSTEQVERIVAGAVKPETWHQAPVESSVGRHISQEFEALEAEVGPRLAESVVAVKPPRRAPTRSRRVRSTTAPPSRSTFRSGRKKRSLGDKLIFDVAMPAAGLFGLWAAFQVFINR